MTDNLKNLVVVYNTFFLENVSNTALNFSCYISDIWMFYLNWGNDRNLIFCLCENPDIRVFSVVYGRYSW